MNCEGGPSFLRVPTVTLLTLSIPALLSPQPFPP